MTTELDPITTPEDYPERPRKKAEERPLTDEEQSAVDRILEAVAAAMARVGDLADGDEEQILELLVPIKDAFKGASSSKSTKFLIRQEPWKEFCHAFGDHIEFLYDRPEKRNELRRAGRSFDDWDKERWAVARERLAQKEHGDA